LRRRLSFLVTVVTLALVGVACGRATEDQINQALGITPTATLTAEEIAASTAAVTATHEAKLLAASTPSAPSVASVGDVAAGKRQYDVWCIACHSPGGAGPDLLSAGSVGSTVTLESMTTLIREGENHPPGAYTPTDISDKQLVDITAYILSSPGS
jgi:mono/diheme cytochrome c family protein